MIGRNNWKLVAPALAVLALGAAIPVWAHGFPGGRRHEPVYIPAPQHAIKHFGPLVNRLLDPCRSECLDDSHFCSDTADAAALACAQQTCDASIQTARTACATDRSAQACKDAITALRTCIQPCVDTEVAAVTDCRDALVSCLNVCSGTPTPTPTPGP